jgi:short-subunit dehydrogenase
MQLLFHGSRQLRLSSLIRAKITRPDFQKQDVAISLLCPWSTKTAMTEPIAKSRTENTPTSKPEDVAWAAAHFLSVPREQANGKAIWIQGREFLEVEESYTQWLMPKMHATGWEWKDPEA